MRAVHPFTDCFMRTPSFDIASRARAALIHLALSAAVGAVAAVLVFALWYPSPYRDISGGRELFTLVITIDIVVGPLITLLVYDRRKPRAELARDLGVVALLQVAALAYGLHSVALARPAVVALEGSRLRVVRAIDLADADLSLAPEGLRALSWTGPQLVATRAPRPEEALEAIDRGLAGEDIGMRPAFWRAPSATGDAFARAAKPLDALAQRDAPTRERVQAAAAATGLARDQLGYLPILARRTDWTALVDRRSGTVVGFVNVDGF